METSNMRNMVVLKKLPSNLVEEAIIILKSGAKVKKVEKIDKGTRKTEEKDKRENDYILKEAEMLVTNYISKIEESGKQKMEKSIKVSKNYKRLKCYAYLSSILMLAQAIVLIIK